MEAFKELIETWEISLLNWGFALAILIISFLVARVIKSIVSKRINPKSKNPLIADFLSNLISAIIVLIGFVLFFQKLGFGGMATTLVTGAGLMTFVIGFAFKDIGENFLSGILMAFSSPFRVGDLIESQGIIGYVTKLNLRETSIKSLDGKDVFIPNSTIIKEPLSNYTLDGFLRYEFTVGIDYNSDPKKAINIILTTINDVPDILDGKHPPLVFLDQFAPSTIDIRVLFWLDTLSSKSKASHFVIKSEAMTKVLDALKDANIGLPSGIVELKNYLDQPLELKNVNT